jgi:hypothetical protein
MSLDGLQSVRLEVVRIEDQERRGGGLSGVACVKGRAKLSVGDDENVSLGGTAVVPFVGDEQLNVSPTLAARENRLRSKEIDQSMY